MPSQRQIHLVASATQPAIARCHKTNEPIPSDRWRYKCYVLSRMFLHVNNFMPLYFKLVHVAVNVQQRPLGSHFTVGKIIWFDTPNSKIQILKNTIGFLHYRRTPNNTNEYNRVSTFFVERPLITCNDAPGNNLTGRHCHLVDMSV
jgi:hypothetical protein